MTKPGPYKRRMLQSGMTDHAARKREQESALLDQLIADLAPYETLSREDNIALILRAQAGDSEDAREAHELAMLHNARLVIALVGRIYRPLMLPMADLVQEGMFGLDKAITKFNPKRGYAFSTYASWWITQAITRADDSLGRMIHLPIYVQDILRRGETETKTGYPLSDAPAAISLDDPQDPRDPDSEPRAEHVADEQAIDPEEAAIRHSDAQDAVLALLNRAELDARELTIIAWRYGLAGRTPLTLEKLSRRLGITRERVRQIEMAALKKLGVDRDALLALVA